jgi:hypothetical protein
MFFRGRKKHASGQALELSLSGIAVFSAADFELGEAVEVRFPLPQSSQKMRLKAIARNHAGQRWGFQFATLKPVQLTTLQAACRLLAMQ